MVHPAIIAAICASSIALLLVIMFVVGSHIVAESENAANNVEAGNSSKEKQANGVGKAVPNGKRGKKAGSKKQLKVHNSPSSDLVVSTGEKKPRKKYQNIKKASIREIRINMDPPSRPTEDPPTYGGSARNSKCSVNLESQDAL
uniref:Uncharacterized protein n=1 Tax=Ditylenchus dipsaci TaxID=166011 RepID=A0A915EC62_9BILA